VLAQAVTLQRKQHGDDKVSTVAMMYGHGMVLKNLRRLEDAERVLTETLTIANHIKLVEQRRIGIVNSLATIRRLLKMPEGAVPLYLELYGYWSAKQGEYGANPPKIAAVISGLYRVLGRDTEAAKYEALAGK